MASIGTLKEALLKQIEGQRNKITVDKILPLLEKYDDLTVEDFKGHIPDELFAQLRNPQESKAWNAIISASPEGEQGLKELIGQISDFIKKYPESEKLNEAEILKKGFETDLVSMKIWEEMAKANPSSQKEIGYEVQRLTDFIGKYPNFSRIEDARKRREELENRIDDSLWRPVWSHILTLAASDPGSRDQCEALLKDINSFIDEYPVSPKLDDAISLKSEFETKLANLEGEEKSLNLEWQGITQQRPTTVAEYRSLISRVSDFADSHPHWSNIAEAQTLLQSLRIQLDSLLKKEQEEAQQKAMEEQRRQEEEARRRKQEEESRRQEEERLREEMKWKAEWEAIIKANPVSAADKQGLINRISSFISTYPNCPKINEAKALKNKYENELVNSNMNESTNNGGNTEEGNKKSKLPLIIGIVALILIGCLIALFATGSDEKKEETDKVKTEEEAAVSEPIEVEPVDDNVSDLPSDKPADKLVTDKPTDKPTAPKPTTAKPQEPAKPQVPDWVKNFDNIDRNVKGGTISKIDYTPDKYAPKGVVITVRYPDFSKSSMTAADHEAIRNLNKEVITKYRKMSQVDIKVVALDVNNQPID